MPKLEESKGVNCLGRLSLEVAEGVGVRLSFRAFASLPCADTLLYNLSRNSPTARWGACLSGWAGMKMDGRCLYAQSPTRGLGRKAHGERSD